MPWQTEPLSEWAICGMNHYHVKGEKRLFVSMTWKGRCIVQEGPDNEFIWESLRSKARAVQSEKP